MLRIAILRPILRTTSHMSQTPISNVRQTILRSFTPKTRIITPAFPSVKFYSTSTALAKEEVEGRIVDLLKNFDKVTDPSKLSPTAHFYNDLGLDSLDTVEVVMAIEEEFSLEIPDKDADSIQTVDQAVNYILAQPDAH